MLATEVDCVTNAVTLHDGDLIDLPGLVRALQELQPNEIYNLAAQIARIEAGLQQPVIRVGNLDSERDFLDVRDVARAYALALQQSAELPPGAILNVASGIARCMKDVLDDLLALSKVTISVELDPARMRPSELKRFVGDATRARRLLGWEPHMHLGTRLRRCLTIAGATYGRRKQSGEPNPVILDRRSDPCRAIIGS